MDVMENLREVYLDRTGIRYLPWSIEHLKGIQYLDLAHCESLESLPESICNLRSLKTLLVHNCSKLYKFPNTLRSFEHLSDFGIENVKAYCGHDAMELDFLLEPNNLEFMNQGQEFIHHWSPEPEFLQLWNLEPKFFQHGSLNPGSPQPDQSHNSESSARGTPNRSPWEDQMPGAILTGGCSLYWLEELDLSYCNLKEGGIASEVFHLPSLQVLNLSGNNICKVPSNISNLSKLRILKMNHCKLLLEIPELPSSLREIDGHGCPSLLPLQRQTQLLHSLLNCFKSDIQVLFSWHRTVRT